MLKVGSAYYFIAHAYHHYIGTVAEVSPRWAKLVNCVKVMGDSRGWEKLLFRGFGKETSYQHVPDGTLVPLGAMPAHPFDHDVPKRKA